MEKSSQGQANAIWHSRPVRFVPVEGNRRKRLVDPPKIVTSSTTQHRRHERKALHPLGRERKNLATRSTALPRSSRLPSEIVSESTLVPTSDVSENEIIEDVYHHFDRDSAMPTFLQWPDRTLLCHAYPSDLPTEIVAPLFHLWSSIAPSVLGSASGTLHTQVGRHLIANSGPFHSCMMTALEAQGLAAGSSSSQRRTALQAVCQSIGIQQARNMLANLNTNAKQSALEEMLALLQITLALGTQTTEEPPLFRQRQHQGPSRAPLQSLGMLDVYGSGYRFRNLHTDAMHRLIALAGGLEIFPTWARVVPSK